jgi:hypothetical protein
MPAKRSTKQPTSVHQLKVTLLGLMPPVWREVAVPSDFTLGDLHHVIQLAMGWEHSHMHDFRIGKLTYVDPRMPVDPTDQDEEQVTLAQVAPRARRKFRYTYDFGDGWEHEVQVEAVGPPEPGTRYPIVLAGERACPPEDCGGVWGYANLLEVLSDPNDPEYEEMLEWVEAPIDPEAFDLKKTNTRLQKSLKYVWTR